MIEYILWLFLTGQPPQADPIPFDVKKDCEDTGKVKIFPGDKFLCIPRRKASDYEHVLRPEKEVTKR